MIVRRPLSFRCDIHAVNENYAPQPCDAPRVRHSMALLQFKHGQQQIPRSLLSTWRWKANRNTNSPSTVPVRNSRRYVPHPSPPFITPTYIYLGRELVPFVFQLQGESLVRLNVSCLRYDDLHHNPWPVQMLPSSLIGHRDPSDTEPFCSRLLHR
jgi:hypothetical protein